MGRTFQGDPICGSVHEGAELAMPGIGADEPPAFVKVSRHQISNAAGNVVPCHVVPHAPLLVYQIPGRQLPCGGLRVPVGPLA